MDLFKGIAIFACKTNKAMRRKERLMTDEEVLQVIKTEDWGTLCVADRNGMPYGVPLNYGYSDGKFYIHHTVAESLLSDILAQNNRVCFTIVSRHEMDEQIFSTHYTSVIVRGTARILTDETEKVEAMMKMMYALAPNVADKALEHCKTSTRYIMIEITTEEVTGKHRK